MNPFSIAALVASGIGIWLVHRGMEGMFRDEKERSRSPFGEKLLRPPGESLRLRIEELKMEMLEKGLVMAVFLIIRSLGSGLPQCGGLKPAVRRSTGINRHQHPFRLRIRGDDLHGQALGRRNVAGIGRALILSAMPCPRREQGRS